MKILPGPRFGFWKRNQTPTISRHTRIPNVVTPVLRASLGSGWRGYLPLLFADIPIIHR